MANSEKQTSPPEATATTKTTKTTAAAAAPAITDPEPWQKDFTLDKVLKTNVGGFNAGLDRVTRNRDGLLCIKKKMISARNSPTEDEAARESHIIRALTGHPNINDHIATFVADGPGAAHFTTWLIVRYCDRGSLADLIVASALRRRWGVTVKKPAEEPPFGLPEEFVWHVFRSACKALAWLHEHVDRTRERYAVPAGEGCNYVLHRDIKPENIFLCTDRDHHYPRVILGDFGASMERDELLRRHRGDRNVNISTYFPPEHPTYGKAGDIWGVGATMMETASLGAAMGTRALWNHRKAKWEWEGKPMVKYPEARWLDSDKTYTSELKECIRLCLDEDPAKRVSTLYLNDEVKRGFQRLLNENKINPNPPPLPGTLLPDPKEYECPAPGTTRPSLYVKKPLPGDESRNIIRTKKAVIERDPEMGSVPRTLSFVGESESKRIEASRKRSGVSTNGLSSKAGQNTPV